MASYDVALTSSAKKELKKLSNQLIARIAPRLESLASNPRPPGCKKLKGGERVAHGRLPHGIHHRRKIDRGGDTNPSSKRGVRTMTAGFAPPWAMTLQLIRSKNTPTQAKAAWVGHPARYVAGGTLCRKDGAIF